MGKGGNTSTSTATIPRELKPLYAKTGEGIQGLQDTIPVSDFTGSNPANVAPLSRTQQRSADLFNTNLDDAMKPLDQSEIVQAGNRYFDYSIAPGIENDATMSGLGRSTALASAKAAAEANAALPLLQGEQKRRDAMVGQGLQVGDIERSVEQQGYNAEHADYLRRQGLAEQALFGVMGQLPSTFGSSSKTSGGGGLFK